MGKRINPFNKINQRSIGFELRQVLFFAENPDFKPDKYCRDAIDEQIKLTPGGEIFLNEQKLEFRRKEESESRFEKQAIKTE